MRIWILFIALLARAPFCAGVESITPHCSFESGPINGVLIDRDGGRLAVYGWSQPGEPPIENVLLPHGRRDLAWIARPLVEAGAKAIAPARELYALEKPVDFWNAFTKTRFHDYGQQSTKILARPLKVDRWVKEGDAIEWRGMTFRVLETPGFTRGSVSYVTQLDGKKLALTGDLIYGDGRILDLYSFQDAIPEAQIRGYHGYGSRLAGLVSSLRKIAAEQPDLILPARGPVIRDPQGAIDRLVNRVQALYRNYLSTNALHWYFKEERMRLCGQRVLGPDADVQLMPYSHHEQTPDWVYENSTSRLIVSESGHAFLLDCGYQRVIDAVAKLITDGAVKKVDGIFVTHYHDDHTDMVQAAADVFQCPVYATSEYADVLERPGAYHLPAMTANAIKKVTAVADGHKMKWQEFDLTFQFFPGQTFYHGALLAKKADEKPILFVGDSFAPSGLDDYCVLNRNLVHNDSGFLRCLKKLRGMNDDCWLVNQHIRHVFAFSEDELAYLEDRYRARIEILGQLFPWDDPNYGVDEQWAVFQPYGVNVSPGEQFDLEIRITNHSPAARTFSITPRIEPGGQIILRSRFFPNAAPDKKPIRLPVDGPGSASMTLNPGAPTGMYAAIQLPARKSGRIKLPMQAGDEKGNFLVTADIRSEAMEFHHWIEALVTID